MDIKRTIELAKFFKDRAKRLYGPSGDLLAEPISIADGLGPLRTFTWEFSAKEELCRLTEIQLEKIDSLLSRMGLSEFSLVAEGGTALCFKSGQVAVRVGPNNAQHHKRNREDNLRPLCPLIIKPDYVISCLDASVLVEGGMPFVASIADNEVPPDYVELIPEIIDGTSWSIQSYIDLEYHGKDLGIFYQGTPILKDPDALVGNGDNQIERDLSQIRVNCEKLGLQEPLNWVTPDNKFIQCILYEQSRRKPRAYII
ncbi:MAG: hypothetical protein AAF569_08075 [Pseudomonadota bacterium]